MRPGKPIMDLFGKRKYRLLAQALFWICLLGSMNLIFLNNAFPRPFFYRNFSLVLTVILLISWNIYRLVPHFFSQKQYGRYTLSVLASMVVMMFLYTYLDSWIPRENLARFLPANSSQPMPLRLRPMLINPRYLMDMVSYTAAIMASTVFESVQLHRQQEQQAAQIQHEKLETEMKFLKSQINPHFLFNALNNVYTLSLLRSEQTPEVVMKLSEMLRYMLYESNEERVMIEQEIRYINNYVALQQLKGEQLLSVTCIMEIQRPNETIAPMILIPFVENAFKHSKIEDTQSGWIDLVLREQEGVLDLCISNSLAPVAYTKDPTGGIGLQNVRRRLELEYPKRHQLQIRLEQDLFRVELSIQLQ